MGVYCWIYVIPFAGPYGEVFHMLVRWETASFLKLVHISIVIIAHSCANLHMGLKMGHTPQYGYLWWLTSGFRCTFKELNMRCRFLRYASRPEPTGLLGDASVPFHQEGPIGPSGLTFGVSWDTCDPLRHFAPSSARVLYDIRPTDYRLGPPDESWELSWLNSSEKAMKRERERKKASQDPLDNYHCFYIVSIKIAMCT